MADLLYKYNNDQLDIQVDVDSSLTVSGAAADAAAVGTAVDSAETTAETAEALAGKALKGLPVNAKIIAHRGYHAVAAQNTIASFIAAAEAGFKWIEIDIRKCADGVYVLAHDATVTMYNNGSSVSVNIPNSNYSTIKGYTWDSSGTYKLSTLLGCFNTMRMYDMGVICDLKNGSNEEIIQLASMAGVADRIMVSYSSTSGCLADLSLLKDHDEIPIRLHPNDYTQMRQIQEELTNPLYAQANATGGTNKTEISLAITCGLPIIFSGCTANNAAGWAPLACGCMAEGDYNISYSDFEELVTVDCDNATTITPSSASITLAHGATLDITAQSDLNEPGGYVYAYALDPTVVLLTQKTFGQSVTVTVSGETAGTTTIRWFDVSGAKADVAVTVT